MVDHIGDFMEEEGIGFIQSIWAKSSIKNAKLGTVKTLSDGRQVVYCKNGAVELAAGTLLTYVTTGTSEGPIATAAAVGDRTIHLTAAGVTANDFEDGMLVITAGAGIGEAYKIRSNSATASGIVHVHLYDAIATALLTTTTYITVYPNRYKDVVVCPVDMQQLAVGCAQRIITASADPTYYYFWAIKSGLGALLIDVAGAAAGLEYDEQQIVQSPNHAGKGYCIGSPAAGTNYFGQQVVAHRVAEVDITDDYATLVDFCI